MKKIKAFTLAETLIVLVILGVVAAITIPALVNRHMEAERRTKLRKAMSVYDAALNKMVIENGIKSDTALVNWADSNTKNDCANTSAYFKVARNLEVNGNATNCKFRAPDGVFWDISDIKKPLIALREQDLNDETAQSDTNRAFYMFGWFDENGSLRSNDMGKISATDKADLQKLYDFIAGKTKTTMGEIVSNNKNNDTLEENDSDAFFNLEWEKVRNGDYDNKCTNNEKKGCYEVVDNGFYMYDSKGTLIAAGVGCEDWRANGAVTDITACDQRFGYRKPDKIQDIKCHSRPGNCPNKIVECSFFDGTCYEMDDCTFSISLGICDALGYND